MHKKNPKNFMVSVYRCLFVHLYGERVTKEREI